jgi:hypothetical protein
VFLPIWGNGRPASFLLPKNKKEKAAALGERPYFFGSDMFRQRGCRFCNLLGINRDYIMCQSALYLLCWQHEIQKMLIFFSSCPFWGKRKAGVSSPAKKQKRKSGCFGGSGRTFSDPICSGKGGAGFAIYWG